MSGSWNQRLPDQPANYSASKEEASSAGELSYESARKIVRDKIRCGLAQAKAGQLIDGEIVFARLIAELEEASRTLKKRRPRID